MFCDLCGKELYIVYIFGEHHYICDNCGAYSGGDDDFGDMYQTEIGDKYGPLGFI